MGSPYVGFAMSYIETAICVEFVYTPLCRSLATIHTTRTTYNLNQEAHQRGLVWCMWCSVWFKNGPISPSRILWFPLEQSWLLGALFGLEGDCTCCFRKHDGMKYDKPFVRLMLGLYAEVLKFEGGCTSSFKSGSTCCTRILPFQLDC